MTKPIRKFEVYQDLASKWRWRLLARNGQIVSTSNESFDKAGNALRAAKTEARHYAEGKVIVVYEA